MNGVCGPRKINCVRFFGFISHLRSTLGIVFSCRQINPIFSMKRTHTPKRAFPLRIHAQLIRPRALLSHAMELIGLALENVALVKRKGRGEDALSLTFDHDFHTGCYIGWDPSYQSSQSSTAPARRRSRTLCNRCDSREARVAPSRVNRGSSAASELCRTAWSK